VIRASAASGRRRPGLAARGFRGDLIFRLLALAAGGAMTAACGLNQQGVSPPVGDVFFPAGAMIDTSGNWLYVTNSNSDLRYNDGTLIAMDLVKARADRELPGVGQWSTCPKLNYVRPATEPDSDYCCWDLLDRQVLLCDSRRYVDRDTTVRIGSFGGSMVWEPTCLNAPSCTQRDPQNGRLFITVRGNSSITVVDSVLGADGRRKMACAGADPTAAAPFEGCDADHKIVDRAHSPETPAAEIVRLVEEPYALGLDLSNKTLLVGHLRGGAISLIDLSHSPPALVGPYSGFVPPDGNGQRGITSLFGPALGGHFYASSRFTPRTVGVTTTFLDRGMGQASSLDNVAIVGTGELFVTNQPGTETRGIRFVPVNDDEQKAEGVSRAFVLQRNPPVLVGFRMPDRVPVDVLETCNAPAFLDDNHARGNDLRLYVTCFEDGEVYVFDPHIPRLVDIIEVGRGPAGLALDPTGKGDVMYVVGFGANNISVVDIKPGSPTENHVIQRLGFPSAVPR
jgi:DNA-binding beta-propeller fold protein YncE